MSKSPSLRRIQADIRELQMDPSDQYHAAPLENDMFVWHFTIRGAKETDFENGIYHGKILLPAEYPFKPPNIMFTTPNGRFETNTKLCLSFSAYHPELWQPAWGIRLILEALISFLPTKGDGAIGALDWTSDERKRLAKSSKDFCCPLCGNCKEILDKWSERAQQCSGINGSKKSRFQKEIEQLHVLQAVAEGPKNDQKENMEGKENSDNNGDQNIKKVPVNHDAIKSETVEDINEQDASSIKESNTVESNLDSVKASTHVVTNNIVEESTCFMNTEEKNNTNNENSEESDKKDHNLGNESSNNAETSEEGEISISPDPVLVEQQHHSSIGSEYTLLSDPIIHSSIVIFSAIVFLLIHKINAILSDIRELEASLNV